MLDDGSEAIMSFGNLHRLEYIILITINGIQTEFLNDKPTIEMLDGLKLNMTRSEVVEVLGYSFDYAGDSSVFAIIYTLRDSNKVKISFDNEDIIKDAILTTVNGIKSELPL